MRTKLFSLLFAGIFLGFCALGWTDKAVIVRESDGFSTQDLEGIFEINDALDLISIIGAFSVTGDTTLDGAVIFPQAGSAVLNDLWASTGTTGEGDWLNFTELGLATTASFDTEAELEALLTDVLDVFTNNDNPLEIGADDTIQGQLYLYGDTNNLPGTLRLYTAANQDFNFDYVEFLPGVSDLTIRFSTGENIVAWRDNQIALGSGAAGEDYLINIVGESNNGLLTFMEDEDQWRFNEAVWSAGSPVWTSGNDGAGSGLDADLLDGLSSAAFLQAVPDPIVPADGTQNVTGAVSASGAISAGGALTGTNVIVNGAFGGAGFALTFTGVNGGGGSAIQYTDTGATARNALRFTSDGVFLSNRASNGVVKVMANNATAGSGGEVEVAVFEDDSIEAQVAFRVDDGTNGTRNNTVGLYTETGIESDGTAHGFPVALAWGRQIAFTVGTVGQNTLNFSQVSGDDASFSGGPRLYGNGSVTKLVMRYDITANTSGGTVGVHVNINGSTVWSNTGLSATVADFKVTSVFSQARGLDTFDTDDSIVVGVNASDTGITMRNVVVTLEAYID
jgi:hypothetical protein